MSQKSLSHEKQYRNDIPSLKPAFILSLIFVGAAIGISSLRRPTYSTELDLQLPSAPSNLPAMICVDQPIQNDPIQSYRLAAATAMNATPPERIQILSGRLDKYLSRDEIPAEMDGTQCFYKDTLNNARQYLLKTN